MNRNAPSTVLSPTEKMVIAVFTVILAVSFAYDTEILKSVIALRSEMLNEFMSFMTNAGLAWATGIFGIYLIYRRKYRELALILLTIAVSMETSFVLKKIFLKPRPFNTEALSTISLVQTIGYAFPSLHATFCFSIWPFLGKINKSRIFRITGFVLLSTIVFSRIYVGVHYMSDLIAGGIIGYLIAKSWIYLQEKYNVMAWFLFHVRDKIELRRQIAHVLTGVSIVLLLKFDFIDAPVLAAILAVGGITSVLSRYYRIPGVYQMLKFFERPKDMTYFPGKGSFFMVLGALLALLIFPKDIALAAITIMAVGDAVTTIVGTYFGKIVSPLNPSKHLEGTVLAIILSTVAAFSFVSFEKAFLASVVGMIFESLTVRFLDRIIDDNILIPLVAALTMTWIS